jgi:hypothetical protein
VQKFYHSDNEAMEDTNPSLAKINKPFPHRDPYGLDTMYLSQLDKEESWDVSQFSKADLLSFSFLTLRALSFKKIFENSFILQNPNIEFRRSLSKKKWDFSCLPEEWNNLFPRLVDNSKIEYMIPMEEIPISEKWEWREEDQVVGFGFLENDHCLFPKILDSILDSKMGKVYLRTSRQSFYFIPKMKDNDKKGLFIQDKENFNLPEFYYFWLTLED